MKKPEEAGEAGGARLCIGVNLRRIGRLKPQLHKQNLPTQVSKTLVFHQSAQADLVCLAATSSRSRLKLTPMKALCPSSSPP